MPRTSPWCRPVALVATARPPRRLGRLLMALATRALALMPRTSPWCRPVALVATARPPRRLGRLLMARVICPWKLEEAW